VNVAPVLAVSVAEGADIAAHVATVVATAVLGLWVYSRFLAQQITRPPIEFTVQGEPIGRSADKRLIRITFGVRNGGTRECDVWLYWRLLGLRNDPSGLDEREKLPSQVKFDVIHGVAPPHGDGDGKQQAHSRGGVSSRHDQPPKPPRPGYLPVIDGRTFVGAGVTQKYEFVTSAALGCGFAIVLGEIIYMRTRSRLARIMTPVARLFSGLSDRETLPVTNRHTIAGVVALEPTIWRPDEETQPDVGRAGLSAPSGRTELGAPRT
jgi:hypothetical protein